MSNGGRIGQRNVPGVDGSSGVWSMRESAAAVRAGVWPPYDLFDTNSISRYMALNGSVWTISGGELVGTNGSHALLLRRDLSFNDGWVEADTNYAHDGGLVLRVVDAINYYLLTLSDDSGDMPSQNLRMFKAVAGGFTQIGTFDMTWARGTSKTVRFSVFGTTLSAYVDGSQVISVTDTQFANAGWFGTRNNGTGQSKYQALRWFF